ncbi:ComF family protein [Patescibacteria group bacterium]|nr:ComF family protein [Patescibacteria group bacterium]MCL5798310.1 ComF family protein [Patescibacteria group bacterium]
MCTKPAIDGATHPVCKTKYGIDGMYAAAHFRGPVKRAIHLLKYQLVSDMAQPLVHLLFGKYPSFLTNFDYLIPVPLHNKREKERGFNQSYIISRLLSTKLNLKILNNALRRVIYTLPQAELKEKERFQNIKGAFYCDEYKKLKGKAVIVVDDVSTTRSTLLECAKVLKHAGVKIVWGIVLAHG